MVELVAFLFRREEGEEEFLREVGEGAEGVAV